MQWQTIVMRIALKRSSADKTGVDSPGHYSLGIMPTRRAFSTFCASRFLQGSAFA